MNPAGEHLVIAATLDEVQEGQEFHGIPLHMSLSNRFILPEDRRREIIGNALDHMFRDDSMLVAKASQGKPEGLYGAGKILFNREDDGPARLIKNVNTGARYGLRSLLASLGVSPTIDLSRKDSFVPRIADTSEYKVQRGEVISFSSVALLSIRGARGHRETEVIQAARIGEKK